jgi:hypothetical protein
MVCRRQRFIYGSVKIQSPIQKNSPHSDSLTKSGSGAYVVTADAKDNSIIDLASHRFFVADSETVTHRYAANGCQA